MYRNISMIIFIYLAMTLMSCSTKPLHKSKTLETLVERPEAGTIDWIDRMQYDAKNNLSYGYFNDEKDLVIKTMVTDRSTLIKMFAAGFSIHIDTTGKKDPQFSINYPLAQGMQNPPRSGGRSQKGNGDPNEKKSTQELNTRIKTALNRIDIIGFKEEEINNTLLNSTRGEGITAWIDVDSTQTMYYELKIPLQYIFGESTVSGKVISLGIESGEIEMPADKAPRANMSMGPGGGGGRQGGGGRPSGGERPNSMEMQQRQAEMTSLSEPIEIWIKRIELR